MPRLELYFLGTSQSILDGVPLAGFRSNKARALLFYLAVEAGHPHSRDSLAALLWGEFGDREARRSLSSALTNLRQALAPLTTSEDFPPILVSDVSAVQFNLLEPYSWSDVAEFDRLVAECDSHLHRSLLRCPDCIERLGLAVALYTGDFLAGFAGGESAEFDDWRSKTSQRLHLQALRVLDTLTVQALATKNYPQAQAYARRQIDLEPWREVAHRQLMMALAAAGQRNAALTQYEACRRILKQELRAEPERETVELEAQIRKGANGWASLAPAIAVENPYRGLQAFRQADAVDFYGREAFTQLLYETVQRQPLVCVIGPSGCGKSSAVHAGLLHRLHDRTVAASGRGAPASTSDALSTTPRSASSGWRVIELRLGSHPLEALAEMLAPLAQFGDNGHDQAARAGDNPPREALEERIAGMDAMRVLAQHPLGGSAERLLLLIDQFEELYSLCPDAGTRKAFLDILVAALPSAGTPSPVTILLVARADYMGEILTHRLLADALQEGTLVLGPMTQAELERAIVRPAQAQGVQFQDGLVARILADVGDAPGSLPLLEFALAQLWDNCTDSLLTHAAYESIGCVDGALANYAEQVFSSLTPGEQETARKVLMQMVRPGPGLEDARRPASRAELGENGWRLAQRLADARLVVTDQKVAGQETAEIVHEALLRSWGRLREWMDADRAFRTWQQRVRLAQEQWEVSGNDADTLLRGAPLAEAEQWLAIRSEDLAPRTRAFVDASRAQRDAEQAALEAQHQRELAQAQALAQAEHQRAEDVARSRRRLRWLSLGLAAVIVMAVAAIIYSLNLRQISVDKSRLLASAEATAVASRDEAKKQAERALSRQLAAQSTTLADKKPDLALLLALEALKRSSSSTDRSDLLLNVDVDPYLGAALHGHEGAVYALALSPDGNTVASSSDSGLIWFWDLAKRQPIGEPLQGHESEVQAIAFSPDGAMLASADWGNVIRLWDVATHQPIGEPLLGHENAIADLGWSRDGRTLYSTGTDSTARSWDVATGKPAGPPIKLLGADPDGMEISEDGTLVAASDGVTLTLQNTISGDAVGKPMLGHEAAIQHFTFSRDDKVAASCSFDGKTILWDVATGQPLHPPLAGHEGRVLACAFAPDGKTLASGGTDGKVILWDVETGKQIGQPLKGHSNWVRALLFSEDGKTLISGSADGAIMVWDLGQHRDLGGHGNLVRGVSFSPDGRALATGSYDKNVRLWDVETDQLVFPPLSGHPNSVINVAFCPQGNLFASASGLGDVILWDTKTGKQVGEPLMGHKGPIVGLACSPDGRLVASGGFDTTAVLWDTQAHRRLGNPLAGHTGWVLSTAFSPDSQVLATGSSDNTIRLWDVASQKPLGEPLTGHTNWVTSLAFSPDGKSLVSGSSDETIRYWDVATGQQLGDPLTGHTAPVWHVEFNPADGGQTLLSGDSSGAIIRWDAATREPLAPPLRTNTETEGIALSPKGDLVAVGQFDPAGLAHLWRLDTAPWPQRACQIANRSLTPEEWAEYLGDEPYAETCSPGT